MPDRDEMAAAEAELAAATAEAQQLAAEEQQHSVELERIGGEMNAADMRADLEAIRRRTERASQQVERAAQRVRREVQRQLREQEQELEARVRRVTQALAPVKKRLELMQEGIDTLGLYLSAAKGVRVVRDGERAPELEPIIIRQMVLAMDEESGLFADEGGITAGSVDEFEEWLVADEAHVQQIAPEVKSVVALVARWTERDRSDPWSSDPTDRVTHFLVRNGEALFMTSVNDFMAGEVLIPRSDEFVAMFRRRTFNFKTQRDEVEILRPGTREYARAMEASDKRGRHFLRIGLILQGLVDNSDVFAPLHPAGINMLVDPSERGEKVRFVTDAEGGLESGAETFTEWHKRTNAELRPGMRIVGWFKGYDSEWKRANAWTENYQPKGHSRVYPSGWNQPSPPTGVPLLIEDRRPDGGLVCRFERGMVHDKDMWTPHPDKPGWGWRGGERKAKKRASVTVYPTDEFIMAFDLVDNSQQLRAFLGSRRDRVGYREMFPLIKATLFAKQAEEEAEAPFIEMMAGVLARENGVTVEEARSDLPELVRWFKLKNRWARPLTSETMASLEELETAEAENQRTRGGRLTSAAMLARSQRARRVLGWDEVQEYDEDAYERALEQQRREGLKGREHEARAVRMLVAEHRRRVADRRRPVDREVVQAVHANHVHQGLLAIVRPRRGGYVALTVADPRENVYVHEHEYSAKGEQRGVREWVPVSDDRASRWTFAMRNEELWAAWRRNVRERDYLTGPERAAFLEQQRVVEDGEHVLMQSYLSPTAERPGAYVTWVMESGAVVPTDLLRDAPTAPRCIARERRYVKDASGIQVRRSDWRHDDDHEWSERAELPWEGRYARRYAEQIVWGPDAAALAVWTRERERYREAAEHERRLEKRAADLINSIGSQHDALVQVAAFEAFVAARDAEGDTDWPWEDWEEHWHDHHGGGVSGLWGHWDCPPYHAVRFVVRWLVARTDGAAELDGATVRQAFEWAQEGHSLPSEFVPGYHSATVQPLAVPEQVEYLVFGAEPVPEPAPPQEEEPEPEQPDGDEVELEDGVAVVGPEEPEQDHDMFDNLRDALGGL